MTICDDTVYTTCIWKYRKWETILFRQSLHYDPQGMLRISDINVIYNTTKHTSFYHLCIPMQPLKPLKQNCCLWEQVPDWFRIGFGLSDWRMLWTGPGPCQKKCLQTKNICFRTAFGFFGLVLLLFGLVSNSTRKYLAENVSDWWFRIGLGWKWANQLGNFGFQPFGLVARRVCTVCVKAKNTRVSRVPVHWPLLHNTLIPQNLQTSPTLLRKIKGHS